MGKRGRPQNDIDSVDKHSEQSNCSIYLGKNLSRWQEHRSACGGGAGSHEDFARHLLALHAEYCPRSPPAAPSQAKMNRGDGDGLDSAKDGGNHSIALDSDCLRLWRRIQRLAGYETAETEYLYWMLNMAEQILSQESCDGESTKDTSNKLRPLLPTVTSPKSPEMIPEAEEGQIIPESDENLNIAGESANLLPYTVSAPEHSSLPEYSVVNTEDIPVHDDTTSDSNTLPPMESNDNDEDIDVKPTLVADNDSPSQYSLKWPDQTSTILMAQNSSFDPHTSSQQFSSLKEATQLNVDETASTKIKDYLKPTQMKTCKIAQLENFDNCSKMTEKDDPVSSAPEQEVNLLTETKNESSASNSGVIEMEVADLADGKSSSLDVKLESDKIDDASDGSSSNPSSDYDPEEYETASESESYESEDSGTEDRLENQRLRKKRNYRGVRCTECPGPKFFQNPYLLKSHCHEAHGGVKPLKTHLCSDCGRLFGTSSSLLKHRITHSEKKIACDICDKMVLEHYMTQHKYQNHRKEGKVVCDVCGRTFKNSGGLTHHSISHSVVRAYKCEFKGCDKVFKRGDHLKVHERIHSGALPIQCEHCDYRCRQKNSLTWHMKKMHKESSA